MKATKRTKSVAKKLGIRVTKGKKRITAKTESELKSLISKKRAVKMNRKKKATSKRRPKSSGKIHLCAVNLGRRGGKATAKKRRKKR